jgi:hypothetical protein
VPQIEQFSLPIRMLPNGRIATTEQGSSRELADRVTVLCHTPPNWLDGRPGFGLADQRFRKGGADTTVVARQIETWIPDATRLVAEDPRALDEGLDYLGIQVAAR